jgi:hypothetical protein
MYILWWLCIICITSGETLIQYWIWIFQNIDIMKLKDASFLIKIYSFLMSNNKVRIPLTDMINIFMTLYEIVFRIN